MCKTINWQNKVVQLYGDREIRVDISSLVTRFKIPSDIVIEFISGQDEVLKFNDFVFKKS